MNFASLTSAQRSALAALINSGPLRTDRLAKCMQMDPPSAATSLCGLRKAGLVFSKDKNGAAYSMWEATTIGELIFSGRPGCTIVALDAEEVKAFRAGRLSIKEPEQSSVPTGHAITKFAVVTNFDTSVTGTKQQALLAAEELALRTGNPTTVLGLVAQVTPPEQPKAVVTLL